MFPTCASIYVLERGLLGWLVLFFCSHGVPGTLAGWVFPVEWLAKLLIQEDVE